MRRAFLLAALLLPAACAALQGPSAPDTGERFVVFFEGSGTTLNAPAKGVVAAAVRYARAHPAQGLEVQGFGDPYGTPQQNRAITRLRTDAVVKELADTGVTVSQVKVSVAGPTQFALDSQESRRVLITVGQP